MPHGASTVNSFNSPCARCAHVLAETHVVPFGAVSSSDCFRERNREHVLLLHIGTAGGASAVKMSVRPFGADALER